MTEPANARDLFRAAYEHRYTWDANFPGYSADIELKQGDEVYTGHVSIKPDMTVEVSGIADEEVKQSVYTQMRDIVTHRKRSSFEQSHGKNTFTLGEKDSTEAVDILVQGDSMGSNYKIRGLSISQVSRVMGRMAFVIDTHKSLETPEGSLASHYDAVFRNPQTNEIVRELEFEDTFDKIGDYYVMTNQVVRSKEKGQLTTTEFNYSNVKLLEPAVV
ncbi:DUF3386 domain-containing protein [Microcoleus sp. bin38.metabat.b11b12b14.051]|uniref:DUF3386 domain-containing protein n=1 Tax=Microcoleus sp. bin38.metabat.b11b12b14.051 TaxID=2742709 RepID=UPI0025E82E41|nr:DUF3386 domain-containing protein [Microcoleus sp. bin38.metabat.b11b12b14.051]